MATLAAIRANLNSELAVASDAETAPWSVAVRNAAISAGYAALWSARAWKPVVVDLATVEGQNIYSGLTGIRRLGYAEVLDTTGAIVGHPAARLEADGTGGYRLTVPALAAGLTLRLHGWTAYKSTFTGDTDTDDIEPEFARVPLLKAKAVLFRQQLATFARFGQRQAVRPDMGVSVEQLVGLVTTCEQEWNQAVREMAAQRPRIGHALAQVV